MSLCVSVYSENKIYVYADSRVSAQAGGRDYLVTDEYPKARKIGDMVLFGTGMVDIAEEVFGRVTPTCSLEDIQGIVREVYTQFNEAHKDQPEYRSLQHGIEFGVAVHDVKNGVARYTQMAHPDGFELNTHEPKETEVFAFGANSGPILPILSAILDKGGDISDMVAQAFGEISDIKVGGRLNAFMIDVSGVTASVNTIWIRDGKTYPAWPGRRFTYHADMFGNVIANRLTANSASIASSTFNNGAIIGSSINVNDKFTVTSGGIMSAVDGHFSGSITASTITGSAIQTSGSTRHIILDTNGLRSFDGNGTRRISIDTDDHFGTQELRFYGAGGSKSGVVSGSNGQLNVAASGSSSLLVLAGSNIVLGGDADVEDFPVTRTIAVSSSVSTFDFSNVNVVNLTALDSLEADVTALSAALSGKADRSTAPTNMTFDPATRNLKLFSVTGAQLAIVNIPA
jgi:hypothetical protein